MLSLDNKRGVERRRKRFILPIIYFLAEIIFLGLILALIQMKFNMFEWSFWAIGIFIVGGTYSIIKTIHIYKRQRDYPTRKEYNSLKKKRNKFSGDP